MSKTIWLNLLVDLMIIWMKVVCAFTRLQFNQFKSDFSKLLFKLKSTRSIACNCCGNRKLSKMSFGRFFIVFISKFFTPFIYVFEWTKNFFSWFVNCWCYSRNWIFIKATREYGLTRYIYRYYKHWVKTTYITTINQWNDKHSNQ